MDYAEGLFLGQLWSDTDYENRNHAGLFILYGLLTDCVILYNFYFGKNLLGLGSFGTVHIVLLILLFLASPFICFKYYRMPVWGKGLVLAEKVFKAYLILDLTVSLIMPRITIEKDGLQDSLINWLNGTLETYTEKFSGDAGSFSTVMGVLAGGLHTVFVILLWIVALVVIPGLIYIVYRILQYMYDWVMEKLVIRKLFAGYRK